MTEQDIQNRALLFAKKERKRIAKEFTDLEKYPADDFPVSVFMAGSPGAGKTEFSQNLISLLRPYSNALRIDPDDLRSYFSEYRGNNSYLFQGATSLIVEKIHDIALSQRQSFVLDGTFSHYDKAVSNIERSLSKGRGVLVYYVYQVPKVAWFFTQKREKVEGRNVPKEAFINRFLGARDTIIKIRKTFDVEKVGMFFVEKNFETNTVQKIRFIAPNSSIIDELEKESYTREELEKIL